MKSALLGILFSASLFANPLANRPFVNQDGKPFQLYDLKGSYTLVSFVFTRCPLPKMCPLTTTLNKRLYNEWKKTKLPKLQLLMVTLDPDFDKPNVLKSYAKSRQLDPKGFTLATGNAQALSDFAAEFNVIGMPSGESIAHNTKSILLAPDLTVVKEYKDNEWKPAEVLKDIEESSKKASSPVPAS